MPLSHPAASSANVSTLVATLEDADEDHSAASALWTQPTGLSFSSGEAEARVVKCFS